MLPIANNISVYNFATPLINTATPGTAITHVPYDNVAPSVSSAQVDNNASGNNAVQLDSEPPLPEEVQIEEHISASLNNSPRALNAQATFLAQLISQDSSPETAGILVQYEKLVAFSYVKYKPSNATKPAPAPAGVFGRLLQQEKAAVDPQPAPTRAAVEPSPTQIATVPQQPVQAARAAAPVKPAPANDNKASVKQPQALDAYEATVRQVDQNTESKITELA